jgi:putative acetyltransferase
MGETREHTIRPLAAADVDEVLEIIAAVRGEFGLAVRVAALLEPADHALFETYQKPRSAYFVAEFGNRVAGGAGISPLDGGDGDTCELQRMYLRPECRRAGIGQGLLDACLEAARVLGFARCYAETVAEMTAAIAFYERNGFRRLEKPIGGTGHSHNDRWLVAGL